MISDPSPANSPGDRMYPVTVPRTVSSALHPAPYSNSHCSPFARSRTARELSRLPAWEIDARSIPLSALTIRHRSSSDHGRRTMSSASGDPKPSISTDEDEYVSEEHCPTCSMIQNEPSSRRIRTEPPAKSPITVITSDTVEGVADWATAGAGCRVTTARTGAAEGVGDGVAAATTPNRWDDWTRQRWSNGPKTMISDPSPANWPGDRMYPVTTSPTSSDRQLDPYSISHSSSFARARMACELPKPPTGETVARSIRLSAFTMRHRSSLPDRRTTSSASGEPNLTTSADEEEYVSEGHCPTYSMIENEPSSRRINAAPPPRSPMTAIASCAIAGVACDRAARGVGEATARKGVARKGAAAGAGVVAARTGGAGGDSSALSRTPDTIRRMTSTAPTRMSPARIREPKLLPCSTSGGSW